MRKLFDEDFSLEDAKKYLKKLQGEKEFNNYVITAIAVISILAIVVTVIVALVKLTQKEDEDVFDDFDEEEFYAGDEDFAE